MKKQVRDSSHEMNLCLVRAHVETDPGVMQYDRKSAACLFGDVDAYERLSAGLKGGAESLPSNWNIPIRDFGEKNSMAMVVCPPSDKPAAPALRLLERLVCRDGIVTMELIVYGNAGGYVTLSEALDEAIRTGIDNPSEFIRLDDEDNRFLVKRSVTLYVRGPLREWRPSGLEHYGSTIYDIRHLDLISPFDLDAARSTEYEDFQPNCHPRASLNAFVPIPSIRLVLPQ